MYPKRLLRSSAFRLALVYVALFGVSAVLLLGFIYWSTAEYMLEQADETIEAEITGLAERYQLTGMAGLMALIRERLGRQPSGSSIYLLTDPQFVPLIGNINAWPRVDPDEQGWLDFELARRGGEPVHWARAKPFVLQGGFHLLVGRDMYELQTMRTRLVRTMGWGLALMVALALMGGIVVSRSRIRRIGMINQAIGEVMEGDLSQRIPEERAGDDIEELVARLNRMLDELEKLVEGIRRVSDNIAHDLRTPLARLIHRLEVLRHQGGEDSSRETVSQALAEADGLLATFNALLRIARIEARQRRSDFAAVDVSALVDDVAELYEPLFEEAGKKLTLSNQPGTEVLGDRDLLFQALTNLADNALKYTPAGGNVALALDGIGGKVNVVVMDDGPGIPSDETEKVLQRFYRLDSSRNSPGAGLGLSLVAAVAELHDAELRLEDNRPGLRVVLSLPQR